VVAGREATPGDAEAVARLHRYWVAGPGLAKWANSPHPWQALYNELAKYIHSDDMLKRTVSAWHNEIFTPTGSDRYRVEHGGRMRGNRIGPG
jgi:hypothetical protein